jgi:hypothetical protein
LIRHEQSPSTCAAWHADLRELKALKITLLGSDSNVLQLRNVLDMELETPIIDVRARSVELGLRRNLEGPVKDPCDSNVVAISNAFRILISMGEKL